MQTTKFVELYSSNTIVCMQPKRALFMLFSHLRDFYLPFLLSITLLIAGCDQSPSDEINHLESTLKRSAAYADQGQYKAAAIEARNALRVAPDSISAIANASRINLELGQSQSAIQLLEPLKDSADASIRLALAKAYVMKGKYRTASLYLAETSTATDKQTVEKLTLLTKADIASKKHKAAANTLLLLQAISKSDTDKANYFYLKSSLAYSLNKLVDASDSIESALILVPTHTDSLLIKAAIAYKRSQFEQSESLLSDALLTLKNTDVMLPQKAKVLRALSDVLSAQGKSSEAIIYTKLLAQNNPGAADQKAKYKNALDLYKEGKYDEAENILLEATPSSQYASSRQLLGLLSLKKGKLEEAEGYLSENFDPETANIQTLSLLARTRLQLRQPDKVIAMLKEEIKVRGDNADLLALYGLASLSNGAEQEGVKSLKKALEISPEKYRLRVALSDYYLSKGKPTLALTELEKAFKNNPNSTEIQKNLLKHYLRFKPTSTPIFYGSLEKNPDDAELNFLVGSLEFKKGNNVSAEKLLKKAIKLDSTNSNAIFSLASLYLEKSDFKEAEALFTSATELLPNSTLPYQGLANALLRQNKADTLTNTMQDLAKKYPSSSGPSNILSEYFLKTGDIDKALAYAKEAYEKNNNQSTSQQLVKIYDFKSKIELASKRFQNARAELMHALEISPDNKAILAAFIAIEIQDNKLGEAKKLLAQIDSASDTSPLTNSLKSDISVAEGDMNSALGYSDLAWEGAKTPIIARKRYAILKHLDQKRASTFLTEWKNTLPNSPEPLSIKGTELLSAGNFEQAIPLLEGALALKPGDAVTLNNLAWLYQETNNPLALPTAKQAHALAPNNGGIADTYGWILVQQGEITKGIEKLKQAAKLLPENKDIIDHLEKAMAKQSAP